MHFALNLILSISHHTYTYKIYTHVIANYAYRITLHLTGGSVCCHHYHCTPSSSMPQFVHVCMNIYAWCAIINSNGNFTTLCQCNFFSLAAHNSQLLSRSPTHFAVASYYYIASRHEPCIIEPKLIYLNITHIYTFLLHNCT